MQTTTFELLDAGRSILCPAFLDADTVRVPADVVRDALGWELKPQGLCKDDRCLPTRGEPALVDANGVDLAAFARLTGRPLASDANERIAYLGAAVEERRAQLASGLAPDFTLPDLNGRLHSLSQYRGKKVLLVAYASW